MSDSTEPLCRRENFEIGGPQPPEIVRTHYLDVNEYMVPPCLGPEKNLSCIKEVAIVDIETGERYIIDHTKFNDMPPAGHKINVTIKAPTENSVLRFICGTPGPESEESFNKRMQINKHITDEKFTTISGIIERLRQEALAKRKGK